jgi:hypothetical protein
MIRQLETSAEQLDKIRSQLEKTDVPREVLEDFERTILMARLRPTFGTGHETV